MKRALSLVFPWIIASTLSAWSAPPAFSTPDEAVKALKSAVAAKDAAPLKQLFGPEVEKLLDPSPEVRKESLRLIRVLLNERWKLSQLDEDRKLLRLGDEGWPFPVTLLKAADGWRFDTAAGIEEARNRKIGTNELVNLETLTCLMLAQEDYYLRDANKDGIREYCSRFASSKGKKDGLYWEAPAGEALSPLQAALKQSAKYAMNRTQGAPWWGYRYRFLPGQGSHAAGGAYDYSIQGHQVGGWAVLAYPVSHGSSGFKTFLCNQNGLIYEKDLGPDTATAAQAIQSFDPDPSWTLVPEEDLPR